MKYVSPRKNARSAFALVEPVRLLEHLDGLVRVERVERELGIGEQPLEALPPVSREAAEHPLLALEEALALLHRGHVVVDARLPEVEQLLLDEEALPLEEVLQGEEPGLGDEAVLLLAVQGVEQHLERLGAALDDLLEDADALEEVLVHRDALFLLRPLLVRFGGSRDDEELALALHAVLALELVRRPADLADHGSFSPPGPS